MKLGRILKEALEFVKIGNMVYHISMEEMKLYKRIRQEKVIFKKDLTEYEQNLANKLVSRGILRRKRSNIDNTKGKLYFITKGRLSKQVEQPLEEVAPPSKESESWIKNNKARFKEKYGKDYGKYLYGKAWNMFNGKHQ